jgi:hypothetical protein
MTVGVIFRSAFTPSLLDKTDVGQIIEHCVDDRANFHSGTRNARDPLLRLCPQKVR